MRLAFALATLAFTSFADAQDRPRIDGALGLGVTSRHLSYNQDIFGRFAPYDLAAAPVLVARFEAYPFASSERAFVRDLGLVAGADWVFGLSSQGVDGASRDTSFWGAELGLRWRLPFSRGELGLSARWVLQSFSIASVERRSAVLPEVVYQSLRPGLDLRVAIVPRVRLTASLGWLAVLSTGELGDAYFPHDQSQGVDGALGVAVGVTEAIELRAALSARWYGHAFNPRPGEFGAVGGALDAQYGATLSAAWRR
jgi:hypothetical protein